MSRGSSISPMSVESNELPSRVIVRLDVGNTSEKFDQPNAAGHTHRWTVYVKAPGSIPFVDRKFIKCVVFMLHESFTNPIRVVKEPPFQLTETGYGGFTLPIKIQFAHVEKTVTINHELCLFLEGTGEHHIEHKIEVKDPTPEFYAAVQRYCPRSPEKAKMPKSGSNPLLKPLDQKDKRDEKKNPLNKLLNGVAKEKEKRLFNGGLEKKQPKVAAEKSVSSMDTAENPSSSTKKPKPPSVGDAPFQDEKQKIFSSKFGGPPTMKKVPKTPPERPPSSAANSDDGYREKKAKKSSKETSERSKDVDKGDDEDFAKKKKKAKTKHAETDEKRQALEISERERIAARLFEDDAPSTSSQPVASNDIKKKPKKKKRQDEDDSIIESSLYGKKSKIDEKVKEKMSDERTPMRKLSDTPKIAKESKEDKAAKKVDTDKTADKTDRPKKTVIDPADRTIKEVQLKIKDKSKTSSSSISDNRKSKELCPPSSSSELKEQKSEKKKKKKSDESHADGKVVDKEKSKHHLPSTSDKTVEKRKSVDPAIGSTSEKERKEKKSEKDKERKKNESSDHVVTKEKRPKGKETPSTIPSAEMKDSLSKDLAAKTIRELSNSDKPKQIDNDTENVSKTKSTEISIKEKKKKSKSDRDLNENITTVSTSLKLSSSERTSKHEASKPSITPKLDVQVATTSSSDALKPDAFVSRRDLLRATDAVRTVPNSPYHQNSELSHQVRRNAALMEPRPHSATSLALHDARHNAASHRSPFLSSGPHTPSAPSTPQIPANLQDSNVGEPLDTMNDRSGVSFSMLNGHASPSDTSNDHTSRLRFRTLIQRISNLSDANTMLQVANALIESDPNAVSFDETGENLDIDFSCVSEETLARVEAIFASATPIPNGVSHSANSASSLPNSSLPNGNIRILDRRKC